MKGDMQTTGQVIGSTVRAAQKSEAQALRARRAEVVQCHTADANEAWFMAVQTLLRAVAR